MGKSAAKKPAEKKAAAKKPAAKKPSTVSVTESTGVGGGETATQFEKEDTYYGLALFGGAIRIVCEGPYYYVWRAKDNHHSQPFFSREEAVAQAEAWKNSAE